MLPDDSRIFMSRIKWEQDKYKYTWWYVTWIKPAMTNSFCEDVFTPTLLYKIIWVWRYGWKWGVLWGAWLQRLIWGERGTGWAKPKKKKGKEMKEYQSIHILVYFFENVCVCADIYQKQCKKKISKKEAAKPPSLWLMVKGHSVTILSLHQVRPQAGCSWRQASYTLPRERRA